MVFLFLLILRAHARVLQEFVFFAVTSVTARDGNVRCFAEKVPCFDENKPSFYGKQPVVWALQTNEM